MKRFYIIPGWNESSSYKIYQSLAKTAQKDGYEVVFYNIDWDKKLSAQVFPVEKNSIIFGFSLGAILASLVAQKYKCKKLILGSMTPLYYFKDKKMKKELIELLGKNIVDDLVKNVRTKNKALNQITIYGDREKEDGNIIVSKTGHRLNQRYNNIVSDLL